MKFHTGTEAIRSLKVPSRHTFAKRSDAAYLAARLDGRTEVCHADGRRVVYSAPAGKEIDATIEVKRHGDSKRPYAVVLALRAALLVLVLAALSAIGCGGEPTDDPATTATTSALVGTWSRLAGPARTWTFDAAGRYTYQVIGQSSAAGGYADHGTSVTIDDGSAAGLTMNYTIATCGPDDPRPSPSVTECLTLSAQLYYRGAL